MSQISQGNWIKKGKFPYTVICWIFNHKLIALPMPEVLGLPSDYNYSQCKRCGYREMEKITNDHILFMALKLFSKYVLPSLPPYQREIMQPLSKNLNKEN